MSQGQNRVLLTGASGLLGRAIYKQFKDAGWKVLGLAFSRANEQLKRVDITNPGEVKDVIQEFKPNFIIHAAAQRFPDKVEKDPEGTTKLNIVATEMLAKEAASINCPLLYISTDYVFDGKSAPFSEKDTPNPLNEYGRTKLEGEKVTLAASSGHIVLRVPLLYGPVEDLKESAATCLLLPLLDKSKSKIEVPHLERRQPAYVYDIANICIGLAEKRIGDESVSGIFQWSGKETLTKYEMVLAMASVFKLSSDHVVADEKPSKGAPRPFDTQLNTKRLDDLGIGKHTPFKEGICLSLNTWVNK